MCRGHMSLLQWLLVELALMASSPVLTTQRKNMMVRNVFYLTHWGRVTHICVRKQAIVGSDNGLSPDRRQAIIWPNAGLLLIGPLGTNFSEILIEILTFSFKKIRLKVSSVKRRPFCLGLNVLKFRSETWTKWPTFGWRSFQMLFGSKSALV